MREAIIIAIIVGFLFFAGSGALTALAIKNATDSAFWDIVLSGGVAGMLMSIASLAVYISSQIYGRPFWMPILLINLAICFATAGVLWHFSREAKREAVVSFQKLAVFWVNVDQDVYQIGVVPKFFNSDSKSYLLKGISFQGKGWSFFPRGSYYLRGLLQNEDKADILEDNYIKPNNDAYFQKLLPIKFDLTLNGGNMPDFVLRGEWDVSFGDEKLEMVPNWYAVMPRPISQQEWDDLRKPQSSINVESLYYKQIPPEPQKDAPDSYYMLYSRDRSATVDNPYFAETTSAKSQNGVLVFVGGKGPAPVGNSWIVLGRTYSEVWSDPEKLALYNSICPPDEHGRPQAFGFFAGMENVMAGRVDHPLAAPTTKAADIIDFRWPEKSN